MAEMTEVCLGALTGTHTASKLRSSSWHVGTGGRVVLYKNSF